VRHPDEAMGITSGKVVWEDGVGMLVDSQNKPAEASGNLHLFLDQ
jgi:hypothetical protein